MFYPLLRKLLFQLDEEDVHHLALGTLDAFLNSSSLRRTLRQKMAPIDARLHSKVAGLSFEHPVGLAAGFDKVGSHVNQLASLGFSHVEIGTITQHAQPGNARPRMFRLPKDRALLNRMGFNNDGSDAALSRLHGLAPETLVGINIGKSKVTPLDAAAADYVSTFTKLYDLGSYFVVNVSSPNTPGLRELQDGTHLRNILRVLIEARSHQRQRHRRPIFVKLSPDLSEAALDEALDVVLDLSLDGIIASNTTISRKGLKTENVSLFGNGGLSGAPLRKSCLNRVERIYRLSEGKIPIIAVGGISNAQDVLDAMLRGASLTQLWTGLIYEGPFIVQKILAGLSHFCEISKIDSLDEIVGQFAV